MLDFFKNKHHLLALKDGEDGFCIDNGETIIGAGRLTINQDRKGLNKAKELLQIFTDLKAWFESEKLAVSGDKTSFPQFVPFQSSDRSFSVGHDPKIFTIEETNEGLLFYGELEFKPDESGALLCSSFLKLVDRIVDRLSSNKDLPEEVQLTGFITSSTTDPFA